MAIKIPTFAKPSPSSNLKISKPTGKSLPKVTLKNRVGKAVRSAIDYPLSGKINNPDYTQWNKNIREGNPEKNIGFKKGGKVKKTGIAKVHKGEVVIPKKLVRKKTYSQVAKSVRKTMGYGK